MAGVAPRCFQLRPELSLAPHEEYVFLDTLPPGLQYITHTRTLERFPLPPSVDDVCVLEFGDGDGYCSSDVDYVLLEEMGFPNNCFVALMVLFSLLPEEQFPKQLLRCTNGTLH